MSAASGVFRDLGTWFWRLLPANPILVRVVSAGGKRSRHMWARLLYPATLFLVMLINIGGLGGTGQSLAALAKESSKTFMAVSLVQLFLMSFIAPIFTAGAITQEKDSNTFHILLTTPLSNAQIVLGSLMSRLYFVLVLLLSGLPIFGITMIYGGVTTTEVFQSFGLAGCTGLVTGSLAIMVSMLKIGTRRTIFTFFLGVAIYLLAILAIGLSASGQLPEAPLGTGGLLWSQTQYRMSWLAPIHPFLALFVVTGQTPAPAASDVYHYGWPGRWLLANPQYGYMVLTSLASAVMVLVSLIFVRRGAKEGETTIFARLRGLFHLRLTGGLRRRPRRVWRNPIAWREAATRGSAGGRSLLRYAFIGGGFVGGIVLLVAAEHGWLGSNVPLARAWLKTIVWIELAVILLVVTNTAATTLTREKESQTIELLLSTPLTSNYIIAGMAQGLVRFALPLIAVPTSTILLFVLADLLHGQATPVTTVEAVVLAPLLMVAFCSLAALIGLQFSLLSRKTVQAVMLSTVIVMGAAGLLSACGFAVRTSSPIVSAVIMPFTPFPAIAALIDVDMMFDLGMLATNTAPQDQAIQARVVRAIFSLIATAVYLLIAYSLYTNLVRSFDMTVRRQSA